MEGSKLYQILGIFSIAFAAVNCEQMNLYVTITESTVYEGDDVTVKCQVLNPSGEGFFIMWVKRMGNVEAEIAVNKHLNDEFRDEGRYEASMEPYKDFTNVTFSLKIRTDSSDNGKIGCRVNKIEVFADLTVRVNVKKVSMTTSMLNGSKATEYTDGDTQEFKEGEIYKLACYSEGAIPEPTLKVLLGGEDISSRFSNTSVLERTGRVKGLQKQGYSLVLRNDAWLVTHKYANKTLECVSMVPDSELPPKRVAIDITLSEFKPQFECPERAVFKLHEEAISLTCAVYAQPEIQAMKFYWTEMNNVSIVELTAGENEGYYTSVVVSGEDSNSKVMTLKLKKIFPQHFRRYTFMATNAVGTSEHVIDVIQDPDGKPLSGAVTQVTSLTFTFVSILIISFVL